MSDTTPDPDRAAGLAIRAVAASDAPLDAIFELLRDVYTTSDQMSEALADRCPDAGALAAEIDALHRSSPGALFLVAEAHARPCGYLIVRPRAPARLRHTADLQMGVHSMARGRGVGRRLLDSALERLACVGVVEIVYLMVRADNRPALDLYAAAGFERLATLQRDTLIDGRYHDGVLLRRFVRPPADPTTA
jgi:ribosomal protein S18 acetylase RimI-like enzyme